MKILVISMAGIGDTLLATPLIHELRVNFPDATIDALVLWSGAKDLLEGNPHLNRIHQKNLITAGKWEAYKFLKSVGREKYDVSINTHPQTRIHYRIIAKIIGAPLRISHEYETFGWLDRKLVNDTVPQSYDLHTIQNNEALLPLLGAQLQTGFQDMQVFLTPAEHEWADKFVEDKRLARSKKLGIHVGSGGTKNLKLKRWPLENYIDLIGRLNKERKDVSVLLFGGPEESVDHEKILAATDRDCVFPVTSRNLREAAALMVHCDAFLSVDTALMHLATAMKVSQQLVIEAPTLNKTNLPFGNPYTLIDNPGIKGKHLEYYRFDGKDIKGTREELLELMNSVTVTRVLQVVNNALPYVIR